jgi:hypothetical protein
MAHGVSSPAPSRLRRRQAGDRILDVDGNDRDAMPLEGGIGITYVSEPGESFDTAARKLRKRVESVLSGRWVRSRRRARQRSLNAS